MIYRLADFTVDIQNRYKNMERIGVDYAVDPCPVDLTVAIPFEEVEEEVARCGCSVRGFSESSCILRVIAEWLPLQNGFLLHSACFDVDGVGVAFAAHSGTGKTTHMMLWQQLLGDRMTVVNGDKPIVRFFDEPLSVGATIGRPQDKQPADGRAMPAPTGDNVTGDYPYAYGTPWNGKEHLGCNMRTPLKHLCFIERAEQNSCEPMTDTSEAIVRIFNQVYMPKNPASTAKTVELIDRLMDSVQLWKIKCNMDPSAAEVAYNTIFGK